jgi:two-component system, NtrC family, nitrogen regulation sensor histidine kinase NtrY
VLRIQNGLRTHRLYRSAFGGALPTKAGFGDRSVTRAGDAIRMPSAGQTRSISFEQASALPIQDVRSRAFWIGLVVMVLSLVSGLATYLILTNMTPIVPTGEVVPIVLLLNIVLILAMISVIAWHMWGLWRAWRDKVAGSRLHIRIVGLFSLIAALPALILAVAATTSFARSLDAWFSSRPRQIIQSSVLVARAYLNEHGQTIRNDLVNMAKDLDNAPVAVRTDPKRLQAFLTGQSGLRDLAVANVIDGDGKVVMQGIELDKLRFEIPPAAAIEQALSGHVPTLVSGATNRVSALTKLQSFPGYLLYVARGINPQVVAFMRATQARLDEYEKIRRSRGPLTVVHGIMYLMTALTSLLAAIWIGFWFAGRFVAPIGRIIGAAQQVSSGNLKVELPVIRGEGDLRRLSQTFNTMTRELSSQRDQLVAANEQLVERRQFMEAVLAGVSAGVLGLDEAGRITIANSSAERLLATTVDKLVGRALVEALPEFAVLLESHAGEIKPRGQIETKLFVNGEERIFSVRLTWHGSSEGGEPDPHERDTVLTFDDITDLVSAQRTSAWGEVARRLAHEIKNPLTPIILSAERIRRKYGRVITEDRETFDKLTATIERQAGDIKTMVDEFASFARIPKPVIELNDLRDCVQEAVILFREAHPALTYQLDLPSQPVRAAFDRRLVTQAMTNLIKNATEAIEQAGDATAGPGPGRIDAILRVLSDRCEIEVIDNGPGLPKQQRTRLLEPYVTTKGTKCTGLGLAIVQKIVEQHGGVLTLEDAPPAEWRSHGALVRITLPIKISQTVAEVQKPAAAE